MNKVLEEIKKIGIVPVVVLDDAKDAEPLAKALCEGGLPCAEVTFRTEAAEESIRIISEKYPEMLVGAGTVLTTEQVDRAVAAGAKFIVSPGFNPKVVKYCIDRDIPVTPGTQTPSEMEQAIEMGLDVVKFFPAEPAGGLKMIKAVAAPYTMLQFMPTGGINLNNVEEYLEYDRILACGGSWMVKGDLVKAGKFDEIQDAKFVSKLPTHEIGQAAVNSLRKYGVDTTDIVRGGDRVGIYYLEKGASQRPSKVIYDRAGSSIATASKSDFDWKKIFEGVSWFHFTGITPALNDEVAEICLEACKAAKEAGVTISCDLNYRNKLWSKEKAGKVMAELCQYVDVCIANEEDAADVFGITSKGTDVTTGTVNHEGYKDVAKQLADRFGFEKVAITLRESISANDNNWSAMLYDGKDYYFSKKYKMHIVDRVGGGDSFGGGLICACLNEYGPQETIEFAVAASCLKHSIEGDYNMVSMDEVLKLAGGDGSGRVQR